MRCKSIVPCCDITHLEILVTRILFCLACIGHWAFMKINESNTTETNWTSGYQGKTKSIINWLIVFHL